MVYDSQTMSESEMDKQLEAFLREARKIQQQESASGRNTDEALSDIHSKIKQSLTALDKKMQSA